MHNFDNPLNLFELLKNLSGLIDTQPILFLRPEDARRAENQSKIRAYLEEGEDAEKAVEEFTNSIMKQLEGKVWYLLLCSGD